MCFLVIDAVKGIDELTDQGITRFADSDRHGGLSLRCVGEDDAIRCGVGYACAPMNSPEERPVVPRSVDSSMGSAMTNVVPLSRTLSRMWIFPL